MQKSKKVGKGNNTNNNYADKLEIYSFTGQETALETVQEVKIQLMVVNQGIRMAALKGTFTIFYSGYENSSNMQTVF